MLQRLKTLAIGLMVATGLIVVPVAANAAQAKNTIEIGWTAWADAEFVTKLAKQIIETRLDHKVKLTLSAIGIQYQGVSTGDLDAMMMAWLPDTHAAYWAKVKDKVVDLGPLYKGAKLGWAVPDYVPKDKLGSISDLKNAAVKDKLDSKIQGIDPGAGLMQLSEKTMKAYDLSDYTLVSASGAAMTAALARAESQHKWIVVTLWTPHWAFGRWKLRFLDDPKGTLGGPQHIDVVVRKGFTQDYPKVASFLKNMYIPLDMLQKAMYDARQTSYEKAVPKFIKDHPDMINKWLGKS